MSQTTGGRWSEKASNQLKRKQASAYASVGERLVLTGEFLRQIIDLVPEGLTPDDAEQSLDEFRENFDYMLSDCGKFVRFYPKLVEEAVAEARVAQ